MYRRLAVGLARGLLRVAERRGRCYPVCLLPGPPGVRAPPCRGAPRGRGSGLLPLLAALAWSSRPAAAEQERRGAGGAAAGDAEAEIIQLLKRAKLCIMKDEPEEAELILHDALHLAHKSHNTKAIAYTYDLMANLAFIRGQLENAEKLFKATMSYLLGGGMQQEDNAIIEISLKLATIYAAQSRQELALAGYEFCISTLEEKIERERELSEDILSALLALPSQRMTRPTHGSFWACVWTPTRATCSSPSSHLRHRGCMKKLCGFLRKYLEKDTHRWILYQLSHQGSPRVLAWVAVVFSSESSFASSSCFLPCRPSCC
ncbi:tetratricopeptide repeat protein 19, mitochondrial isoform X3 [Ovis aries]|uniref:tetratricopeptide repeat protein 19, mitochondrial isoform X3 n=1 Tax=Ovis aries TaxID=9940 RepID=UPI001C2EE01B|nr:tetratricopeptide repeat protein 19, mitochondrial isoform X3 [Ovis aries]